MTEEFQVGALIDELIEREGWRTVMAQSDNW